MSILIYMLNRLTTPVGLINISLEVNNDLDWLGDMQDLSKFYYMVSLVQHFVLNIIIFFKPNMTSQKWDLDLGPVYHDQAQLGRERETIWPCRIVAPEVRKLCIFYLNIYKQEGQWRLSGAVLDNHVTKKIIYYIKLELKSAYLYKLVCLGDPGWKTATLTSNLMFHKIFIKM